jgi:hypothetical protein
MSEAPATELETSAWAACDRGSGLADLVYGLQGPGG